jgi:hypothetical protein
MMETLQAQSALLIAQQHKMAMLERNVWIMGDRLRMHDTKFDCLAAVEPEVINYPHTRGKDWCTRQVHCKYTARKWTKNLPHAHLVHHKYIQNFPSQFPCNFPSPGNAEYIYSVPGHVIGVS